MANKKNKIPKDKIFEIMFDRVMDWYYPPGTKIVEQNISEEFGVSRTPVREVLQQLAVLRLVKFHPNKGAEVVGLTCDDIEEMYEIRQALELLAVDSAVSNVKLQELSEIKSRVESLSMNSKLEDIAIVDRDIHAYIAKCSGKPRLQEMLEQLFLLIIRHSVFPEEYRVKQLKKEHLEIIDALYLRDADVVKKILTEHLEKSKAAALYHIFHKS